jgi:hypothetical protein
MNINEDIISLKSTWNVFISTTRNSFDLSNVASGAQRGAFC